jgi:hypothetical protein
MSSKQREALSDACYAMFNFLKTHYGSCYEEMANALDKAKAALAEPLKNCEVGTAEEQNLRHSKWCRKHGIDGAMEVNCASSDMHCHLCFAAGRSCPTKAR